MKRHSISTLIAFVAGSFSFLLAGAAPSPATQTTSPPPATTPTVRGSTNTPLPAPQASTKPAAPTTREAMETRRKVMNLTRQSLEFVRQNRTAEAEKAMLDALALDPDSAVNLYNMACLRALAGRGDEAMVYLVKSAGAGFTDFIHIEQDSDLNSLRGRADYKFFLAHKDDFQRKAAMLALEALRREFGPGYLYELDDHDKLIFATNTDAATLTALKTNLMAQARSQWKQLFEHKPDQFIIVVVPSPGDFAKIVKMPNVKGFYNHEERVLIAAGLGFVTTHEFTHALHAADIEPLGQNHPIWLTEGLAVLFEHAEWVPDPNDPKDPEKRVLTPRESFRLPYLKIALRQNRLIPLAKMLTMQQPEFVRGAEVAYGEAGNLMLYLHDKGLLRKFYDAYKAGYDQEKTGRAALESTTGMKLADLEADFKTWILRRTPPTMFTGPDGAYLGLRFTPANDGIRIDQVVPGGPSDRAGLRNGDLVVGLNDIDVRDMPSFIPMLAEHKPGEEVTLKLRREKDYLDVPVKLGKRSESLEMIKPATKPAAKPATKEAAKEAAKTATPK